MTSFTTLGRDLIEPSLQFITSKHVIRSAYGYSELLEEQVSSKQNKTLFKLRYLESYDIVKKKPITNLLEVGHIRKQIHVAQALYNQLLPFLFPKCYVQFICKSWNALISNR